jgi:hypothetical protein
MWRLGFKSDRQWDTVRTGVRLITRTGWQPEKGRVAAKKTAKKAGRRAIRASGKRAGQKAAKKKASRKAASRKAVGKKTAGKKAAGKKAAGKKAAGKKAAGKKASGKKASGGKASGRKSAARKTARRKAARKKTARKKSPAKGARRGPGRPPGGDSKPRGSVASRRTIRQIARRILRDTEGATREEAAQQTGAHVDDIKNLKAGNLPSLKLFLRVVRDGRHDPEALIQKSELRKLPAGASTSGARSRKISERVRKLAKENDPATLSDATGLSIYTIYQHRVANKRVGLHTVLAFVDAGVVSAREIFLGRS